MHICMLNWPKQFLCNLGREQRIRIQVAVKEFVFFKLLIRFIYQRQILVSKLFSVLLSINIRYIYIRTIYAEKFQQQLHISISILIMFFLVFGLKNSFFVIFYQYQIFVFIVSLSRIKRFNFQNMYEYSNIRCSRKISFFQLIGSSFFEFLSDILSL